MVTHGMIDPQSSFARIALEGAADEWGLRAAERAQVEGGTLDAAGLCSWLDLAEDSDATRLRITDPEAWHQLRELAVERAQVHAALKGTWRS